MWFWLVGAAVLITWVLFAIRALPGLLRSASLTPSSSDAHPNLRSRSGFVDFEAQGTFPKVSVLLAARNEARSISKTLASLQAQTWPNLEVIAVDDRSTDNTAGLLDAMAASWPELKVVHIQELPGGWLGKPYAIQTASKLATGDWLLLTDADVEFAKDAVDTAMRYTLAADADHLALSPTLIARGFWLRATVYFFLYNVVLFFRPQDADRRESSASVGIGAFNLVRKSAYEKVGGHGSVALRTDEDLALGTVLKKAGFKQVFAGGSRLLFVEWYPTLSEMARGLEKNALAPFQYRFWKFTLAMLTMLLFYDGPFIGTLAVEHWPRLLFGLAFAIELYLFHMTRRYSGVSSAWALAMPLAAPVLFVILARAAILCAVRGGVQWRGTFYSLKELRNKS
ncbi:glycosyltransferase family 2 protein [Alicyclobacillus tolerans]|uniref:glycosyltransferase n=1 Tax=Alicyclobacillus tolerans TaxID=90970 RepID=UPI001F32DA40|nr:glycosyltransferase family 2 protein [Alicyclobacillus tolerans]MCF8565557.1 glycosyltransferase family 2 protein [Alicyclobacillus tolerans]